MAYVSVRDQIHAARDLVARAWSTLEESDTRGEVAAAVKLLDEALCILRQDMGHRSKRACQQMNELTRTE
jgi:hypothetical protein